MFNIKFLKNLNFIKYFFFLILFFFLSINLETWLFTPYFLNINFWYYLYLLFDLDLLILFLFPDFESLVVSSHYNDLFDFHQPKFTITPKSVYSSNIVNSLSFESYMVAEEDLILGEKRLLETDIPLVLPSRTHIRFLVTSDDVLHSFAIPRFGIKIDAVPGRLNEAHVYIKDIGIYYGQCSEICGVNHGFMPIQVIVLEPSDFIWYLKNLPLEKSTV